MVVSQQTKINREDRRNKEKIRKEKGRRKQLRVKLYPVISNIRSVLLKLDLAEWDESNCLNAFVAYAESDPTFTCQ